MILASCPHPSSLQRQWQQERNIRQRVLEETGWRQSIGLALLMDCKPEQYCNHGLRVLMPNHFARWLSVRDLLPGQYHPERLTSVASIVSSRLRYGVPVIDFSSVRANNWNFGRKPRDSSGILTGGDAGQSRLVATDVLDSQRWAREWAAFNRLSRAMTDNAVHRRDRAREHVATTPYPLLAFRRQDLPRLFRLATERVEQVESNAGYRKICHAHFLDQPQLSRFFPKAFRMQFCNSVAEGLPLQATEPLTYLGTISNRRLPPDAMGLPVRGHLMLSTLDNRQQIIYLPEDARIGVKANEEIEASDIWCHALPNRPSRQWLAGDLHHRWADLSLECSSQAMLRFLKRIWFENQAITIPETPDQILIGCDLVSHACQKIEPLELWWDLTDALAHFDAELEAIILPPLPRIEQQDLRLELRGDLLLDAAAPLTYGRSRSRIN